MSEELCRGKSRTRLKIPTQRMSVGFHTSSVNLATIVFSFLFVSRTVAARAVPWRAGFAEIIQLV